MSIVSLRVRRDGEGKSRNQERSGDQNKALGGRRAEPHAIHANCSREGRRAARSGASPSDNSKSERLDG